MDKLNSKKFDLFGILKSWICWQSKYANVSRDFWMPDHSCRVCYECDTQFTLFNRRHHCRLCGRIFCAKCTTNSVPASSVYSSDEWDEWDRVRVCNYCFKQWELGLVRVANGRHDDTCHTPSAAGASGSKSSVSAFNSTISINSMSFSFFEHISENCSLSPCQSTVIYPSVDIQGTEESGMTNISMPCSEVSFVNQFDLGAHRSDEDHNNVYGLYPLDAGAKSCPQAYDYYGPMEFDGFENAYHLHNFVPHMENGDTESLTTSTFQGIYDVQDADKHQQVGKKEDHYIGYECEAPSSLCVMENVNPEPVDFENNGLLWLPPEPENEEDDREVGLFDVVGDDEEAPGEWGHLRTSGSFGSGGHISKDRSVELPKNAMKNVVEGHFRALISQLLQVENIPVSDNDFKESWLEIITSLSWEAATLVKPDTSRSGGMDPGGYVKVKCIASGLRSESVVVKGVVCKKNVAHRRMAARIEKPRIMILGGDLEYQRVSNLLSSFDTLLQQEMDHLKMAVAKIDAHRPNVLLVEKSVSRYAQDYILAKDISLVLNIKRPLLERIARCTGAEIVPSIDHLSTQNMGYCDLFHVDRCFENYGSAGQAGRKLTKNLMYFEGCPKPLGCTILLRGTNGDELKKVKHVVQYAIFAAYHLSLETSFLADEGASLLDHLLNEPIALPNKSVDKSISVVSGFSTPTSEKQQKFGEPQLSKAISKILPSGSACIQSEPRKHSSLPGDLVEHVGPTLSLSSVSSFTNETSSVDLALKACHDNISPVCEVDKTHVDDFLTNHEEPSLLDQRIGDETWSLQKTEHESISKDAHDTNACGLGPGEQDANTNQDEPESLKDEFPSTSSDNQSILVSLSSQCVWKGTVCERAHLFRIKYYGSFDKPLGRFLHDQLFDQSYRCHTCNLSSEAHVQCYTHRQGTLTISVRKLDDFFLSGEREGKIWMWHRCLRCPRMSGFPPATRRVLMSDAAWGLSFGKFLELSFSNHAAASRVAGCGHSLHRDCLRFYGCGKMVVCFRYASINIFSVYLPPAKVEFNYESQDWIWKEANEVVNQAEFLFSEVHSAIGKIIDGKCDGAASDSDLITAKSRNRIGALEGVLQIEKKEFKELHWKTLNKEAKSGCPTLDILDINRLRRQLLLQSYMWDHRLVYAAGLSEDSVHNDNVGPVLVSMEENLDNTTILYSDLVKRSGYEKGETKNVIDSPQMVNPSSKTSPGLSPSKEDRCDLLESGSTVRRAMSDSHSLSLSDTLDVAWAGGSQSFVGKDDGFLLGSNCAESSLAAVAEKLAKDNWFEERTGAKIPSSPSPVLSTNSKGPENGEDVGRWFGIPFLNFYRSINRNFLRNAQKLDTFGGYSPMYVSSFRELELQGGAKRLLPIGYNETVIPVYDVEPTSIISYALVSQDYHNQLSDEGEKPKETVDHSASTPLQQSASFLSLNESLSESHRSLATEESISRNPGMNDQLHFRSLHIRVSFSDNGPHDEVKYTVTCYYAKRFDALRKICCPSEIDFVRSLSRCKKWGAQGGKSNVFFAKTLDERFIIKQVTKTELEAFIKFAPEYFKYVMESITTKSPTCLAKILGIFQVTTKHLKGGKETKMDVLVMENLLFRRNITRLYDLKGSSRSRYNPDSSGSNKVLLDQNLIEAMSTSPIFVGNKAKRLLERAVWNDTSFLASIDVMDYSLLAGVDEENHELVLGIIDFMRQYTWDKHLETWVKASGILGGPKNVSPTVISPMQYKKRFRKAMTTYFLMVPDQWSPPNVIPSQYQTNLCEENTHGGS